MNTDWGTDEVVILDTPEPLCPTVFPDPPRLARWMGGT